LTNDQSNEPKEQGRITQPATPIAGRSELQNREPESGQQYPRAQTNQFYENIRRWRRIIFKDFKRRLHKASFALEVVAILVAGIYTFEAWKANGLTREALESVQRAFVVYNSLGVWSYLDLRNNKKLVYLLRPIWENSGNTPTRNLRIYVSEIKPAKPPYANLDFSQTANTVFTAMFIAPHGVIRGADRVISAEDLFNVRDGKSFFYVWGWATYKDTFPNTKPHMTRFCTVLIGAFFDPNDLTKLTGVNTESCPTYNCADEECEEQDRRAKQEPKK
jgi:hypothetical protein